MPVIRGGKARSARDRLVAALAGGPAAAAEPTAAAAMAWGSDEATDKLYFHSASKDVSPGRGVNERVRNSSNYAALAAIRDWRKTLSNFDVAPFPFRGKTVRTIEHAFQMAKIATVDPVKADRFTVESGHEIGLGDGKAARGGRKMVMLTKAQLAAWDSIKDDVMEEAARAKYTACPDAAAVLLATKDAQLWHLVARSPHPVRFTHLERIRDELTGGA